jgi:hypothetical protein
MDNPPSTTSSTRVSRRALTFGFAVVFTVFASAGIVTATAGAPAPAPLAPATTTRHSAESLGDFRAHVIPTEAERAAAAQAAREAAAWDRLIAALRAAGPGVLNPPTPAPARVVQPVSSGGGYNDPSNPAAWDRIASCESGGNWALNTGNGYYGGIQFSLGSWQSVGGTGRPDQASRETQIAMGQRLYRSGGGWSHWPGCSRALGYR